MGQKSYIPPNGIVHKAEVLPLVETFRRCFTMPGTQGLLTHFLFSGLSRYRKTGTTGDC